MYTFGFLLGDTFNPHTSWRRFVVGFVASFAANLSVSYGNDYFDVELDRYGTPTSVSGGSGVLLQYPEFRKLSKSLAMILMGMSVTIAVVSTMFSFPVSFLAVVILGNLLGWYYSAPPGKLAYRGLSELTVVVAVGLLMPGAGYLIARSRLDEMFLVFLLPSLLYSLAFIVSVEIPDLESDLLGGKNTFIVRKGRSAGYVLITGAFVSSTLYFLALSMVRDAISLVSEIDFRLITAISLIPLSSMLLVFVRKRNRKKSPQESVENLLLGFTVFLILLDFYLILL